MTNDPGLQTTPASDPSIGQPQLVGINETAQAGRLQHLLNISAVGLAVLYALGLWQSLVTRNWLVAVIESALLLLVITATLSRNGDGRLRAVSLLVSLYCAGVLAIVLTPFSGLSQIILLTSVLFAVVLFGYPVGNFLAILAGISVAAGGYGLMMGYLPLNGTAAADYRSILFWMAAGFFCVLGGLVLARAQSGIQRSWETSLTQLQQALLGVEVERDALRESSADLERRLVQLKAVAEISRLSNSVDDPADLMDQVVSLIEEHFNLYYAGIFLLDENLENAVLKAGSGEAGQQMVGDQHQLPVGGASMVGWAVAHGKARIALDTGAEDIRFENPLLPHTRSELALPLRSGKKVIGALSIQSDTPNAFDENDLTVLQGLADAITVALENARRFQEVQSYLKEIESLNRQYLISAWSGHLEAGQPLEYTYLDGSTTPPGKSGEIHHSDLVIRDQVIGSLAVESRESGWNDEEIGLIEAVAAQASQALENARLLRETQNKAYQEELVSDFSSSIRETFNLDAILRTAVRELGDRLNLTEVEAHIGWSEDEAVGEE